MTFGIYGSERVSYRKKREREKLRFCGELKRRSPKRMIVVAPTGVAAINAGGVTIHSFFQLPFGPYVPGSYGYGGAR